MGSTASPPSRQRTLWLVLAAAWLVLSIGGLGAMAVYANRPGEAAAAPADWPPHSLLRRDGSRPALVVIAHPRCDCTSATLSELGRVMARAEGRVQAFVLVLRPQGVEDGWEVAALWKKASNIPGVSVVRDDNGDEAARFGAATSGQVLLYSPTNRLLFSGGLTAARGHEGENTGESAVLALIDGHSTPHTSSPVFGCSLFGGGQRNTSGD